MTNEEFVLKLNEIGAVKFGRFTLKSGLISPFYIDLRDIISEPEILRGLANLVAEKIQHLKFDVITGIPYTALPIAALVADLLNKPLVYMRKEQKAYGTGNNVIGKFKKGQICLVFDDLITTGESKLETARAFEKEGLVITDFVVVIDRSANGAEYLKNIGYNLISLMDLPYILDILLKNKLLSDEKIAEVRKFTKSLEITEQAKPVVALNNSTKRLLEIIETKKSRLVLSIDVDNQLEFFKILDQTASEIVMLKTHIDILDAFNLEFIVRLKEYAAKYNFLIFEDRKFADIGNTVKKQYHNGVYKISQWADFITVHGIPGSGILKGLFDNHPTGSFFLLAGMSAKGNLINETYTRRVFEMGSEFAENVSGYIGHATDIESLKSFKAKIPTGQLLLTPGVKLERGSDNLGQQYISVEDAIAGGADCIIVGRGIIDAENPAETAALYRKKSYL